MTFSLQVTAVQRRTHLQAAALGVVTTAALVLVPAAAGWPGLVAALGVVQAVLALAWVVGLRLPGRIGTLVLGVASAVAADVAAALRSPPSLSALLAVLAVAFLGMVIHQLCRGVVRVRATASIAGVAMLVVIAVAAASLLVLHRTAAGAALVSASVLAIGAAVVVGHLVDAAFPIVRFNDEVPRGVLGLLVGAAAAAAVSAWRLGDVTVVTRGGAVFLGVVLGLVAGFVAIGGDHVEMTAAGREGRWSWLGMGYLQAIVPLALTAPVAYVVAGIVAG